MNNKFSVFCDWVNIVDWGTNLATTKLIYSNTQKAKRTLLWSSIGMSALALGVSVVQSKMIMKNSQKVKDDIIDKVLRN